MNLGEVKTKIFARENLNGKTIYKAIANIDSYEGLPIVTLHQTFESWFDSTLHPIYFQTLLFNETDTSYTKYFFEKENQVQVIKGKLGNTESLLDTTVVVSGRFYDGLTLLYAARYNFDILDSTTLKCYVAEDTSKTLINYYHKKIIQNNQPNNAYT